MNRRKAEERELQTAQLSDLCRRRLLSYADSFSELAKGYNGEFVQSKQDRQEVCDGYGQLCGRTKQAFLAERRLWETRQIIGEHLNEMVKIMRSTAGDVLVFRPMERKKKRLLVQAMAEEGIVVENPCYLPRENGKSAYVLTLSTRKGVRKATDEVTDLISVVLDRRLQPSVSSPYLVESEPRCFVLEEETEFVVLTGFAKAIKENEIVSGDNYAVIEAEKGRISIILSDGTGSGEKAGCDSGKVLDMMEKMIEAGYGMDTAINMVNTALFALGEDENHPTLDICEIDLYQGSCQIRKVGGAVTFLKKPEEVEQLTAGSLPLGIFRQVEVQPVYKKLRDGDYLIMVSDGVVDAFSGEDYENAMVHAVAGLADRNPKEMADQLLRIALRAGRGQILDDMTIGVIGIWEA